MTSYQPQSEILEPSERHEKNPGTFPAVIAGGSCVIGVVAAVKAMELSMSGYPAEAPIAVGGVSLIFLLNALRAGIIAELEADQEDI